MTTICHIMKNKTNKKAIQRYTSLEVKLPKKSGMNIYIELVNIVVIYLIWKMIFKYKNGEISLMKINIGFNTIFSRILFFNTLLVVLITVIPQLFFTKYFITNYDNQKKEYNMQLVKQARNYIDDMVIGKIVDIPNTYLSNLEINYDLTYPLEHDISQDSIAIQKVINGLRGISVAYDTISNINIYYTKSNMIFSGYGLSYVGDEAFSKSFSGNKELMEVINGVNNNVAWVTSVQLMDEIVPTAAVFVRTLPYVSSNSNKQAVLAIGFNEYFLRNFMESIKFQEDSLLLILDENGKIVLNSNGAENAAKFQHEKLVNKIIGIDKEGWIKDTVDGKQSIISFSKSKYNNWRYVSIVSVDSYYKKSVQLRNLILTFGGVLLLFSLIFSVLWTKTAHRPLLKILNNIKNFTQGISENDNEYTFLESTFKGLSEKVEELNSKLETNKPIIRHNTILKLLKGRVDSFESDNAEQEFANVRFTGSKVLCFLLKLHYNNDLNSTISFENKMLIEYNIIDILENYQDFEIKAVIDDTGYLVVIISYSDNVMLGDIIEKIRYKIDEILNIKYIFCLGNEYEVTSENINKSYREAIEAYKYSFIKCNAQTVKFTELKIEETNITGIHKKCLNKLEECIRACNENELQRTIQEIINDLKDGNYRVEFCKNILMDMITLVRMTLMNLGYDEEELFKSDLRAYYNKIDNIDSFEVWFKDICMCTIVNINAKREHIGKDLEQKIVNYIENNIFKDLSLESVADSLYISPGYLSKIFKIAFGMSFTEYMVKLKMEKALELIKENNLTVKEISNKLGYNSVQYFIRIFKEKYGLTPKEYQRNIQIYSNVDI